MSLAWQEVHFGSHNQSDCSCKSLHSLMVVLAPLFRNYSLARKKKAATRKSGLFACVPSHELFLSPGSNAHSRQDHAPALTRPG